jgi:hypothetical protein
MKELGLCIRIERELRYQFPEAYRLQDRLALQILREFMRTYDAARGAEKTDKELVRSARSRAT